MDESYYQKLFGMPTAVDPWSPEGIQAAASQLQPTAITIQQQKKTLIPDETFKKLQERQLESFRQQAQGIKDYEKSLKERAGKQEINPLLAVASGLSDMFAGTNNIDSLTQQKLMAQKQLEADQARLQGMRKDLTNADIDMLKEQYQHQSDAEKMAAQMKLAGMKMASDKEKEAKTLTASETEQLADIKDQLGSLDNIYSDWKTKIGGTTGVADYLSNKAAGLIPNSETSEYKANLKQKAQLIGKALEGGKLTDVDYEKYINFLPQPGDTDEMAKSRVKNLQEALKTKYNQRIQTFGEAGYKVGNFSSVENAATPKKQTKTKMSFEEWKKAKGHK